MADQHETHAGDGAAAAPQPLGQSAQPPQFYQQAIPPQPGQPAQYAHPGQPGQYAQPGYSAQPGHPAQPGYPAAPDDAGRGMRYQSKPPRSTAKFVWGIILTVFGALILLGQLATLSNPEGTVAVGDDPVALATTLILTIVLGVGGLAFGILLIATSRRKP